MHFGPLKYQDSFQASANIGKYFQEAKRAADKIEIERRCVQSGLVDMAVLICRREQEKLKILGSRAQVRNQWKFYPRGQTQLETGHNIHPNNANILETCASSKNKRLLLESLHSFLDKNSVNERALFPSVYA